MFGALAYMVPDVRCCSLHLLKQPDNQERDCKLQKKHVLHTQVHVLQLPAEQRAALQSSAVHS